MTQLTSLTIVATSHEQVVTNLRTQPRAETVCVLDINTKRSSTPNHGEKIGHIKSLTLHGGRPFGLLALLTLPNIHTLHLVVSDGSNPLGPENNYLDLFEFVKRSNCKLKRLAIHDRDMSDNEAMACLGHPGLQKIQEVDLSFRNALTRTYNFIKSNPRAYYMLGEKYTLQIKVWRQLDDEVEHVGWKNLDKNIHTEVLFYSPGTLSLLSNSGVWDRYDLSSNDISSLISSFKTDLKL
ncbi:hypothetical protein NLJ89_g4926 [Agrocybe chaxingu]|uniref:Uncharacterized protein n=1 Tax=Agrocybe chaxingu TaxID=84603 RepID=A0A9W8MW25_9AGAR|nr:hypothetical protein NLJ89_g4926 [Agrocybe chaxingu]